MEAYLKDLLERLLDRSWIQLPNGSRTNQGSISWIAHREAEDFQLQEGLLPLKQLLAKEKKAWTRRNILCLIINIVSAHHLDAEIDFLFEQLSQEKSKYLLSGVMSKMYDYLDFNTDKYVNQLITYLKSPHWLIRHDAIGLLSKVQNQKAAIEQLLLTYLQNPIHTCDVRPICGTLAQIGSSASIPYLKMAILNYKLDTALYALDVLDGQNQLDFYLTLYATPRNPAIKEWLIRYISKYDAPQAIPILITRVKKLLSKIRPDHISYSDSWKPELIEIILFLKRYEAQYREIGALSDWIKREKVHFLLRDEVAWFKHANRLN